MNRSIARFRVLMVISVFITMASGCAHETNHGMDGTVTSIRAEYATVAPSLLQAARKLIAQIEPLGVRFKGKPYVECSRSVKQLSGADGAPFDPEAERETTFTVWAVECIMCYGPPEIGQIDRHLSLQIPFTATVRIPVTTSYRTSNMLKCVYRGSGYFGLYGHGHNLPLPVPLGSHSLPKEYPPEVHRLPEKAKALCLKAEQTTDPTKMEVVRFEYLADKAAWVYKAP